MEIQNIDLQGQFNILLQCSEKKPKQASNFPQFIYMESSLKKSFKLLKKTQKAKMSDHFINFWKQLSREEQIQYYMKSVELLKMAVRGQKPSLPSEKQSEILVKKSMVSKWEKKTLRLTGKNFFIHGHKTIKDFQLHKYVLRKSKNKDYFAWVLQAIQKADADSIHCGVSNIKEFEDWYNQFDTNINFLRVDRYSKTIAKAESNLKTQKSQEKQHQTETNKQDFKFNITLQPQKNPKKEERDDSSIASSEGLQTYAEHKTVTQIVLNNQMANDQETLQFKPKQDSEKTEKVTDKCQYKPNIFKRVMPDYNLTNFTLIAPNMISIHCDSQYRLVELPFDEQTEPRLKLRIILPFPKSYVFKAITQQMQGWNSDIEVLNIKTAIRSQNAAIIYEKHKAQGILYRQRDYLYLRHCFSLDEEKKPLKQNLKKESVQSMNKTFIIDKSIDSVHNPPFMTVARGEKMLIWCLVKGQTDKECLLIVEGLIKGGGYMSNTQNRDMTIKHFKAIAQMNHHLRHKTFGGVQNDNLSGFFKEEWPVSFQEGKQQVVNIRVRKASRTNKKQEKSVQQIEKERKEKQKELQEFMNQQQAHQPYSQQRASLSVNDLSQKDYRPPPFNEDNSVKIPTGHITARHEFDAKPKSIKPTYFPHFRGHHLWKGQWQVSPTGGLNYIDEQKMAEQKKVITFIIKRIGKNILTGKGILNVSLPVDIFCIESNIQKLAMTFGFHPFFMEKAAGIDNEEEQMKYIVAAGIPSSLIYVMMEKPFNPILGQTYQCWMDGCPIYFEQISHHPPIASFLMKGRGYDLYGSVEAKMDISINSGAGYNDGIFTVSFKNGNTFYYTTPKGQLQGLTYGVRKLNFVQKSFYWTKTGLFLQVQYNPFSKKKSFFGGNGGNYTGQEKLSDYFEGTLKRYDKDQLNKLLTPKKEDNREFMIVPKAEPTFPPKKELYKVDGRCFKSVRVDGEIMFDADQTRYYSITEQPNPLPSHANYREDIVYRRMRDCVRSQDWKQKLEVAQRKDRKLKEDFAKKSGKKN